MAHERPSSTTVCGRVALLGMHPMSGAHGQVGVAMQEIISPQQGDCNLGSGKIQKFTKNIFLASVFACKSTAPEDLGLQEPKRLLGALGGPWPLLGRPLRACYTGYVWLNDRNANGQAFAATIHAKQQGTKAVFPRHCSDLWRCL